MVQGQIALQEKVFQRYCTPKATLTKGLHINDYTELMKGLHINDLKAVTKAKHTA